MVVFFGLIACLCNAFCMHTTYLLCVFIFCEAVLIGGGEIVLDETLGTFEEAECGCDLR